MINEVSQHAKELVLEFFDIHKKPPQVSMQSDPIRWSPPQDGLFKANFDIAFFDIIGIAGIRVVICDFNGNIRSVYQKVQTAKTARKIA